MAAEGQKRRSAPGMRYMCLNSPSFRCMMGNTRPSDLKKTGTRHRKNGKTQYILEVAAITHDIASTIWAG